jgi:predicted Zn-ribbon and HTH transcriptional regulator
MSHVTKYIPAWAKVLQVCLKGIDKRYIMVYTIGKLNKRRNKMENSKDERRQFSCKRCGWIWLSHMDRPIACARCKSPYWDVDRAEKQVNPAVVETHQG